MFLLRIRRRLIVGAADLRFRSTRASLAREKSAQVARFHELTERVPDHYAEMRHRCPPEFIVPDWRDHLSAVERDFSPAPPFGFLRYPRVLFTMFILGSRRLIRDELSAVERLFERSHLAQLLEEDYVGDPVLMNARYRTSSQAIHHLYHLARFTQSTRTDLSGLHTIVEWGAGYGSMAKILRRLHGGAATQVLVDLPVFSILQFVYLGTVFGPDEVRLLTSPGQRVEPGKITMVPVGLADEVTLPADLFVSTWAISESAAPAQDYVVRRGWFGARHLLLAYQRSSPSFPQAERIGELAVRDGAKQEPVNVLRGSSYAFR